LAVNNFVATSNQWKSWYTCCGQKRYPELLTTCIVSPVSCWFSQIEKRVLTAWSTWPHWRFRCFRTSWPAYTKRKYRLVISPYEPCALSTKC